MASNPSRVRARANRRLRHGGTLAGMALACLAAAAPAGALAEGELVADIYVDRPTVLVFVPPPEAAEGDADAPLGRALAAQALSLTSACLGRHPALYQLVVADRIVLHDGARTADFDIAATAPLTGVLLAAPRANPSVLFAGAGPEALAAVAPLAAARYFHLACGH